MPLATNRDRSSPATLFVIEPMLRVVDNDASFGIEFTSNSRIKRLSRLSVLDIMNMAILEIIKLSIN